MLPTRGRAQGSMILPLSPMPSVTPNYHVYSINRIRTYREEDSCSIQESGGECPNSRHSLLEGSCRPSRLTCSALRAFAITMTRCSLKKQVQSTAPLFI